MKFARVRGVYPIGIGTTGGLIGAVAGYKLVAEKCFGAGHPHKESYLRRPHHIQYGLICFRIEIDGKASWDYRRSYDPFVN